MKDNNKLAKYDREKSIVFRKTKEKYGGLSNMAAGYPIQLNGYRIRSSEALYQALKFTDPEIQKIIISQHSPMTAKMKSKKFHLHIRNDWEKIKIPVMKWCLRVKLVNNWGKFGDLLDSTQDFEIVEESSKDAFWGAKPIDSKILMGQNYLGRLLKLIRNEYRITNCKCNYILKKLDKYELVFMGQPCEDLIIYVESQKIQHKAILNSNKKEYNNENKQNQITFL